MGWRILAVALVGAISLSTSTALAAETLFGVTTANLVTIDPTNPANVTIIGPHNLPANNEATQLTYDPVTDRLLELVMNGTVNPQFYSFNRSTGQATALGALPNPSNSFIYEGTEFVGGTRNQVVMSQAPSTGAQAGISSQIFNVNPDTGLFTPITFNGRDNDFFVWDSKRDRFYATDPNGSVNNTIYQVNLVTGASTDFIPVVQGTTAGPGDLAYSTTLDSIFATDFGANVFWRINLNASGNPATLLNLGTVPGQHISSIAFAPAVPEPSSLAVLALIAVISVPRKRKPL